MEYVEEAIREREQFINKSMFEDDEQWDLCYENFKLMSDLEEENNSTNQESKQSVKTLDQLKRELAWNVPVCQKKEIFQQGFTKFEYFC